MTIKEQADQLEDLFKPYVLHVFSAEIPQGENHSTQCAIKCVDMIIKSNPTKIHGHLHGKDIVESTVDRWKKVLHLIRFKNY